MKILTKYGYYEKLYLSKSLNNEIYIYSKYAQFLKPFQRDGIRFLYSKFIKECPGVIINDASEHGKTVQVVLFLNAVRRTKNCSKGILVLCDNKEVVLHWQYHFDLWTDNSNEYLTDNCANIYVKRDVFVASIDDCDNLSRRDWSIVVVDEINVHKYSKYLAILKSEFKVWLTCVDLKVHLNSFKSIYRWILPTNTVDFEKFNITNYNSCSESRIKQAIQFEIFCDGVLMRRQNEPRLVSHEAHNDSFTKWRHRKENFKMDIENSIADINKINKKVNTHTSIMRPPVEEKPYVSRKNKDATGLKIKNKKRTTMALDHLSSEIAIGNVMDVEMSDVSEKIQKLDVSPRINNKTSNLSFSDREIPEFKSKAISSLNNNVLDTTLVVESNSNSSVLESIFFSQRHGSRKRAQSSDNDEGMSHVECKKEKCDNPGNVLDKYKGTILDSLF